MLPYKVLAAALPAPEKGKITITIDLLRFLLSAVARCGEFDEEEYLRRNPDVAIAVRQGKWSNGQDHYAASGYFEDRTGIGTAVSEFWYLRTNPDVALAVKNREWQSAEEHYNMRGLYEWRIPNPELADEILNWKRAVLGVNEQHKASEPQEQESQSRY